MRIVVYRRRPRLNLRHFAENLKARLNAVATDLRPALAAAFASMFFGASVTATRFVVAELEPLTLAFLRYLIGTLCLLPFVVAREQPRPTSADLLMIGALGIVFFGLFPWFFSAGLQFIPASRAAVWLAAMPFLTFALALLMRSERFSLPKASGVALATIGAVLALGIGDAWQGSDRAWLGDLLLFSTACCGAIYFVFSRGVLKRLPALLVTCMSMIAGVLFLGVIASASGRLSVPHISGLAWATLVFLGTFGAAFGFYLWLWALQRLSPTRTAVFLTLNPIAATFLSVLLLDERLTFTFVIGLAFVLFGIVVANRTPRRSP